MSLLTLQLRPASYKGIRFDVSDSSASAGRRTVLHEYPLRDKPYAEDIGRAAKRYTMTAVIAGVDYIARTKRLLEALESPGGGTLVHPWLGSLNVTPTEVGKAKFDKALGRATLDLSFVESGALENPSGLLGKVEALRESVDSALSQAQAAYDKAVQVVSVSDSVISMGAQAWGQVQQMLTADAFLQSTGIAKAISLINIGSGSDLLVLGRNVLGALNLTEIPVLDWKRASHAMARLSADVVTADPAPAASIPGTADAIAAENAEAVSMLVRSTLAIQAAGAASMVADGEEGLSYDDLMSLQADVCDALDAAALECPDDELAQALDDLHDATHSALSDRARDSARLVEIDASAGTPLVVAAYRRYADAERADEIARINAVRHLGFSPAGGMIALSR